MWKSSKEVSRPLRCPTRVGSMVVVDPIVVMLCTRTPGATGCTTGTSSAAVATRRAVPVARRAAGTVAGMTETLQRPARPSPPRPARTVGVALAGLRAALVAAALGLLAVVVPVLVLWAVDDRAGAGAVEALRTAGQLWLVAHGVTLEVPGGAYGLTPLGLLLLPGWLLLRAGRASGPGAVWRRAASVAGPYAGVGATVALLSGTGAVTTSLASAVGWPLLLAAGAVIVGGTSRPTPDGLLRLDRPVLAATAVLVGAGALLVGASLAVHLPRAAELAGSSGPGVLGGLGLLLAGLALVPNAVLWGSSWLAGPGFAVGAGTAVGPFGHELGPVPALPLLAALPGGPVPGWVGALALAVPITAGLLAGVLVHRARPDASAVRTAVDAAVVGLLPGALWTVLAWASGGPAGGERLTQVGPGPWSVGLALALSVGAGAVAGASLLRYRARP